MSNYEATKYDFSGASLTGIEGTATGTILPWSTASIPTGFLECAGANVSRSTYADLFGVIGTTYGAGDGSTTFGLPNLADNVPVGKSGTKALASTGGANTVAVTAAGSISSNTSTNTTTNINVTGNVGGSTGNATLSTAQLASHAHGLSTRVSPPNDNNPFLVSGSQRGFSGPSLNTNNSGSGSSHSHSMSATFSGSGNAASNSSSSTTSNFSGSAANPSVLQPYLTIYYIIKT
jgi:microcystin-dependent protein